MKETFWQFNFQQTDLDNKNHFNNITITRNDVDYKYRQMTSRNVSYLLWGHFIMSATFLQVLEMRLQHFHH